MQRRRQRQKVRQQWPGEYRFQVRYKRQQKQGKAADELPEPNHDRVADCSFGYGCHPGDGMEASRGARGKGRGTDPAPVSRGSCKLGSRGDVSQRRCTRWPPQLSPALPKAAWWPLHCILEKVHVPAPRQTLAGERSGRTAKPIPAKGPKGDGGGSPKPSAPGRPREAEASSRSRKSRG